jgi:hypothetical protein
LQIVTKLKFSGYIPPDPPLKRGGTERRREGIREGTGREGMEGGEGKGKERRMGLGIEGKVEEREGEVERKGMEGQGKDA